MKKPTLKHLASFGMFGVAALLTACATPPAATEEVPVGAAQVRYTLPAALFADTKPEDLGRMYAVALADASEYRAATTTRDGTRTGVETTATPAGVSVAYLSHATRTMYHDYRASFEMKSSRLGDSIVVEVNCPASMKVELAAGPIAAIPWSPFIERAKAVADLKQMCSGATLKGTKRETGEVNVNFPDASVYANFARKLKAAPQSWGDSAKVSKDDLAKFKWFAVPDGNSTRVLGITVFPYRNGSKVTYVWRNEATCHANARCNFDPLAPKRMQDLVTSIAND